MTPAIEPICQQCARLRPDPTRYVCAAFPKGIPMDIVLGIANHKRPHKGDGGLTFRQRVPASHVQR